MTTIIAALNHHNFRRERFFFKTEPIAEIYNVNANLYKGIDSGLIGR